MVTSKKKDEKLPYIEKKETLLTEESRLQGDKIQTPRQQNPNSKPTKTKLKQKKNQTKTEENPKLRLAVESLSARRKKCCRS